MKEERQGFEEVQDELQRHCICCMGGLGESMGSRVALKNAVIGDEGNFF